VYVDRDTIPIEVQREEVSIDEGDGRCSPRPTRAWTIAWGGRMKQPQEGERWISRNLRDEVEITGVSVVNSRNVVTFTKGGCAKEVWELGEFLRRYEVVG
jgi:hypothetical protein